MQPRTQELTQLESGYIDVRHLRSFELYEEYSQRTILDTIRIRKENFDKAGAETKRELQIEVEKEVKNFRTWLEKTKNLEHNTAHYYSTSLKSLLFGLPIGVQVAQLFDIILDAHAEE